MTNPNDMPPPGFPAADFALNNGRSAALLVIAALLSWAPQLAFSGANYLQWLAVIGGPTLISFGTYFLVFSFGGRRLTALIMTLLTIWILAGIMEAVRHWGMVIGWSGGAVLLALSSGALYLYRRQKTEMTVWQRRMWWHLLSLTVFALGIVLAIMAMHRSWNWEKQPLLIMLILLAVGGSLGAELLRKRQLWLANAVMLVWSFSAVIGAAELWWRFEYFR